MPIQVTHLKQKKFWKNNTVECGAQAESLKYKTSDEIVLKTLTKKGTFWGCVTPEKALELLQKNSGLYEIISEFPHKVYFDIDAPVDRLYNETEQSEHLNTILNAIKMYFLNADCAVSGSYTDAKISYHITLQNYMIYDLHDRETMRVLNTHIKDSMNLPFDNCVYSKNRSMKCINQTKPTDNRIQTIIQNDNWKDHMITCFFNNNTLPFPEFTPDVKEKIDIAKAHVKFNMGALPMINLSVPKKIEWYNLNPIEILGLLPLTASFDFVYKHRVARFCFYNKLSFDVYLNWLRKGYPEIEKNEEGQKNWDNLHKYPPVSIAQMKPILAYYYPDIKKDIHLRNFKELFDVDSTIKRINIERLGQEHYNNEAKLSCFHLGMGCGKTAQTIDYLANNTEFKFCWVGHRQSLHQGTYKRICDANIECCNYMVGTKQTKPILYNEAKNLGICINSLVHLNDLTKFDVIVIDEIESVLEAFIGDFMQNKQLVLGKFINLIKNAEKIIVLDAFITNKTIEFFRAIDEDITIDIITKNINMTNNIYFKNVINDEKTNNNNEYIKEKNVDKDYKMQAITEIVSDLKKGKKIFIFYPYKKDMEEIAETIELTSGKKCMYYHADRGDDVKKTLCNVNETWSNYDCIITNTCITCGVNYDLDQYYSCWLFLAGFVKPRDATQVSARIRNLASKTINVVFLGKKLINPSVYIDDRKLVNDKIYNTIYKNSLIEDKCPRRKAFEIFCQKSGYKMDKAKLVFDTQLLAEIKNIFEETNCGFDYVDIPDIHEKDEIIYKQLVMSHQATLLEKLMLRKMYIKQEFNKSIDENEIGTLWDNNLIFFFQKMSKMLNNVKTIEIFTEIFNEIQIENKWKFMIPCTREINSQTKQKFNITLSDSLIEKIFLNFNFRDLNKYSKPIQIVKNIFNITFGTNVINSKNDGKHTTASINNEIVLYMPLISYLIRCGTYTSSAPEINLYEEDWVPSESNFVSKSSLKIGPKLETYFYK